MHSQAQVALAGKPSALPIIARAGLLCGAMDITAAIIVYGHYGARPIPLLQGIAGGLLGPQAWNGGLPTAFLGLACHFFIAFSAATVYFVVSRKFAFLIDHGVVSGLVYGPVVYFFMNRIVVPFSRAHKYPFSVKMMLIGVTIHIFCVGLPIATVVSRYSRPGAPGCARPR